MKFFYWNKNFAVGIPEVDVQHRRLVDLINALAAELADGGRLPGVQTLFGALMDYATTHFAEEEQLIEASALSKAEKALHRKAHRGFIEKAREISRRSDLLQAEVAERVLEFLTTWLISHILRLDKELGNVLQPGGPDAQEAPFLLDASPVERVLIGALAETERRFRLISDHAPALIWVSDATGTRGFFNRVWTNFVGIDGEAGQEFDWMQFVHPDDRPAYRSVIIGLLLKPEPAQTEYRLRRHDGEYAWILETIMPRIDKDSGGVFLGLVASGTDVSIIRQAGVPRVPANDQAARGIARPAAAAEESGGTDPLTGLANRRLLTSRLKEEVLRATYYRRTLTAAVFDVDHFSRINDTLGMAAGDVVLCRVAEMLKAGLREFDVLGRFGDATFVVLFIETGIADAVGLAERLRGAIGRMQLPEIAERQTVSAGVAEWRPGEAGEVLLRRSDLALERAKVSGRNCVWADNAA